VVKPAAGDLAAAADALRIADVLVLPNHTNILLAARQAASLTRCTLHVVPSETLVQGVAAAIAFAANEPAAANLEAMTAALGAVRSVEVTRAAASRTVEGIAVREGQWLALLDGKLVAAEASALDALVSGLARGDGAAAGLITVYAGEGEAAARAVEHLRPLYPGVEVEGFDGGQPIYVFVASIEQ
jgi:dihydroxyacetone kinase-like predicted kinase